MILARWKFRLTRPFSQSQNNLNLNVNRIYFQAQGPTNQPARFPGADGEARGGSHHLQVWSPPPPPSPSPPPPPPCNCRKQTFKPGQHCIEKQADNSDQTATDNRLGSLLS